MNANLNAPAHEQQLLVGTYTERLPHVNGKGEGILGCTFADGRVGAPSLLATIRNPSFLMVTPSGRHVYAVSETSEFEGQPGGGLTAFSRDLATGALRQLNAVPSGGEWPCHVAVDPLGDFVVMANYMGSVAVFRLEKDGGLGQMTDHVEHSGSGPDPVRQPGPHPHMVCFYASEPASDPPNRDLLVPDLGTDAVLTYSLTTEGKLAEKTAARIATSPGAGPRHLRFHPNGRHLFILNELDSTLMMLRFEGTRFVAISTVSTLGAGSFPGSTAAELRVSASGGYVFASNRGPDSDNIAMFAFDENSEEMSLVHVEPSRGKVPRDIISSPDGRYLLVANQDTDTVVAFAIDEERPGLELANMTEVPTPVCLAFA